MGYVCLHDEKKSPQFSLGYGLGYDVLPLIDFLLVAHKPPSIRDIGNTSRTNLNDVL
jgi:hypothetical protein